jgi:succinate dehydrogenase flavin-adding protein (antitoxin of CptAB toxin-antitoxin module)
MLFNRFRKIHWDKIADKMIKVYEEILNRKDSKR